MRANLRLSRGLIVRIFVLPSSIHRSYPMGFVATLLLCQHIVHIYCITSRQQAILKKARAYLARSSAVPEAKEELSPSLASDKGHLSDDFFLAAGQPAQVGDRISSLYTVHSFAKGTLYFCVGCPWRGKDLRCISQKTEKNK